MFLEEIHFSDVGFMAGEKHFGNSLQDMSDVGLFERETLLDGGEPGGNVGHEAHSLRVFVDEGKGVLQPSQVSVVEGFSPESFDGRRKLLVVGLDLVVPVLEEEGNFLLSESIELQEGDWFLREKTHINKIIPWLLLLLLIYRK